MKKRLIIFCAIVLGLSQLSYAVPARRGKFVVTQPDGTTVTLQMHGDEFYHWITRDDGTVVSPDKDGFYRPSPMPDPSKQHFGGRKNADLDAAAIRSERQNGNQLMLAPGVPRTFHFPVILAEFSDVKFTSSQDPNTAFYNLLNQEGYSANGGTGSVRDYYFENSMGTFLADFDVYGPFSYEGTCAANSNEEDAAKILKSLIESHPEIDWSIYDNDNDGRVDMVFLYYAGYNAAEGARNTIWPHKWTFSGAGYSVFPQDGKSFGTYACTSELDGTTGSRMCGIGTCAHEFSHTQGLPDFYDTNYNNYGDGEAGATYDYDIMCMGCYNNDGRTPPYFSAEERVMMGWLDSLTDIPAQGQVVIPAVDDANMAYRLATDNTSGNGEYFIFETRGGKGWDLPLQPGLLVYHVDKSTTYSFSVKTGYGTYNYNGYQVWTSYDAYINASGSHPCFYIVPAAAQSNLNYYGNVANLPFPGRSGITTYSPKDWGGNTSYGMLVNISFHADGTAYGYAGDPVVVLTRIGNQKGVSGAVKDASGSAVAGATVSAYAVGQSSQNAPSRISGHGSATPLAVTTTDETGYYTFDLSSCQASLVEVEVEAEGYFTACEAVEIGETMTIKNFTLRSTSSLQVNDNYILNPGSGTYSVGDEFALTLIEANGSGRPSGAVSWYFDDEPVSGQSVTLKYAGKHLVEARFPISGGKTKMVELEINVQ